MDNLTVEGKVSLVVDDVTRIRAMAADIGLQLNERKCEIIGFNSATFSLPQTFFDFIPVESSRCELLGAALFVGPRLDKILDVKVGDPQRVSSSSIAFLRSLAHLKECGQCSQAHLPS